MDSSSTTTEVVGSTNEILGTLLEYLVDPLLPVKSTSVREAPPLSQQESVAKQMHATVLLYNYYQRKCHPELQFLDFESFCKLAITLKPSLMLHMKSTHQCDLAKVDDLENELSLTEKAVMNACSLSRTLLDASQDISSSIKEWPIIKVAVLLVDSTKENCLLLFNSVTNGVWSVIEEDLVSESIVVGSKRKRFKISKQNSFKEHDAEDEAGFQKVAFSAVKKNTGINGAELKVLESNVVYTLSKEKTAARFYIVQSTEAISEDCRVPIKDVLDSLQGPLVSKSSGSWIVTPAVEYYHVLPYGGIISDWFSRDVLFISLDDRAGLGTLDVNISRSPDKMCKKKLGEGKGVTSNTSHNVKVGLDSMEINSLSIDKPCDSDVIKTGDSSDKSCTILDGSKEAQVANEATENPCDKKLLELGHCNDKQESVAIEFPGMETVDVKSSRSPDKKCKRKLEAKGVSSTTSHNVKVGLDVEINSLSIDRPCDSEVIETRDSSDKSCTFLDGGKEALVVNEATENPSDKVKELGPCNDKQESVAIEFPGQKNCNASHMVDISNSTSGSQSMDVDKNPVNCLPKANITTSTGRAIKVYQYQKRRATSTPAVESYKNASTNGIKNQAEVVTNLKTEADDRKTESCISEIRNEKVDTKKVSCVVSPNLDGAQTVDRSLVPFELKTSNEEKIQVTFASKQTALSQTALRVLVRKREKLCNELHNLEDEMAVCERNIQAILNGGAENNLAIKLEAILECCNDMCLQSKTQAQYWMNQNADNQGLHHYPMGKRLSEAILSVRTPCQELNDICCANNWILPMFRVTPSDGGFLANVAVKGLDFECSCESDLHPTPLGARNMAAERIIAKLQNMSSQVQ